MHSFKIIIIFFLKNSESILKQIAWETKKKKKKKNPNKKCFFKNVNRPNGSWLIDQNNIVHVLINNSRTAKPTKISMPFMRFSGNLLQDNHII